MTALDDLSLHCESCPRCDVYHDVLCEYAAKLEALARYDESEHTAADLEELNDAFDDINFCR